jgi:hypothetical protein
MDWFLGRITASEVTSPKLSEILHRMALMHQRFSTTSSQQQSLVHALLQHTPH